MNIAQIANEIKTFNTVPSSEVMMHAAAILKGDYSIADLRANAKEVYDYNGYAHEDMLMDQM